MDRASPPKKQRERQLINVFLQLLGMPGSIAHEREAPDYVLCVNGRPVGVELTELFVPNDDSELPLKARESLATRIVDEARRVYDAAGGTPLQVAVGFLPQTDFRALNRSDTARSLAAFLFGESPLGTKPRKWRTGLNSPLPAGIHFVHAFALTGSAASHWYAPQAGWIVPLTEDVVQASINQKALRLNEYRRVVPEVWLVLVIAGGAPSQGFDFRHQIDGAATSSPFDRTFLLSLIDGSVQEIGVQHRSQDEAGEVT